MANSITLFKQFVPLLDEVYKEASKTAVLDGRPELVQAGANANELVIPKMTMDGLAAELKSIHEKIDARYAGLSHSYPAAR